MDRLEGGLEGRNIGRRAGRPRGRKEGIKSSALDDLEIDGQRWAPSAVYSNKRLSLRIF